MSVFWRNFFRFLTIFLFPFPFITGSEPLKAVFWFCFYGMNENLFETGSKREPNQNFQIIPLSYVSTSMHRCWDITQWFSLVYLAPVELLHIVRITIVWLCRAKKKIQFEVQTQHGIISTIIFLQYVSKLIFLTPIHLWIRIAGYWHVQKNTMLLTWLSKLEGAKP